MKPMKSSCYILMLAFVLGGICQAWAGAAAGMLAQEATERTINNVKEIHEYDNSDFDIIVQNPKTKKITSLALDSPGQVAVQVNDDVPYNKPMWVDTYVSRTSSVTSIFHITFNVHSSSDIKPVYFSANNQSEDNRDAMIVGSIGGAILFLISLYFVNRKNNREWPDGFAG